jgi:hypothetical protein
MPTTRIPDHPISDYASNQASLSRAAHGRQQLTPGPMRCTLSPEIRSPEIRFLTHARPEMSETQKGEPGEAGAREQQDRPEAPEHLIEVVSRSAQPRASMLAQVVILTVIAPAPHANSGHGASPARLQTGTRVIPPESAMVGWRARVQAANQDVSMQSLDEWHRRPKYPLTGHAAGGHHPGAARSYSSPGVA